MSQDAAYRIERDSMGEIRVPREVLYGAQTQRAVDNFRISEFRMPGRFIHALGLIKACAAEANAGLETLDGASPQQSRQRHWRWRTGFMMPTSRWTSSRPVPAPAPT